MPHLDSQIKHLDAWQQGHKLPDWADLDIGFFRYTTSHGWRQIPSVQQVQVRAVECPVSRPGLIL